MTLRVVVAAVLTIGAGCATAPRTDSAATEPVVLSEFLAPYPENASRSRASGTVVLKVTLDELGQVTEVKVLEGQGYGMDEAAVAALRKFRFKPAMLHGRPIPYVFAYRYTFAR